MNISLLVLEKNNNITAQAIWISQLEEKITKLQINISPKIQIIEEVASLRVEVILSKEGKKDLASKLQNHQVEHVALLVE